MLKKKNRLLTKEVQDVYKNNEKFFSKNFLFLKQTNNDLKIAVVISKKKYKKAVERNKARRIIYKIIQNNLLKISKKFYGVIIVLKPILGIEKSKIEKEILWLINKKSQKK